MSVALVLLEVLPNGALAATAPGLLAAAATVGEPVALIAADAEALGTAVAEAATLGAVRVLTAEARSDELTVPVVDALAAALDREKPDLVLASNAVESRDALARLAARRRQRPDRARPCSRAHRGRERRQSRAAPADW